MFGRNRRLATEHTIAAVRPLIAVFQYHNGLPAGFWQDEFVVGFIGFMIGFHANHTSGRKLSQTDKGFLLRDVFTALSNMNGQAIGSEFARLAMLKDKSPDFEKGCDNASVCAFATIGKMNEQGRVYYDQAKEQAKEIAVITGSPNDLGSVAAVLLQKLFFEPLRERFEMEV